MSFPSLPSSRTPFKSAIEADYSLLSFTIAVGGGIKGVGGYINTYGDGVKASMAADGPSSSAQKTTAVKPKPAATPKALPSTGAAKALPAPTAKTNALPKSAAQVSSKPSLKIPDGKVNLNLNPYPQHHSGKKRTRLPLLTNLRHVSVPPADLNHRQQQEQSEEASAVLRNPSHGQ